MRSLKFRIYTDNGWTYWGFLQDGSLYFANPIGTGRRTMEDNLKDSQQFTGHVDNNGREIYQGDIMENRELLENTPYANTTEVMINVSQ